MRMDDGLISVGIDLIMSPQVNMLKSNPQVYLYLEMALSGSN
jgi:hypothetical protein